MTTSKPAGIVNVYTFDQLDETAKEKARDWFRDRHDDPFMQSHMINLLKEELEDRGIKYNVDSIDVRYSLSYSQGDGFMFEGTLYDDHGKTITVKHSGHYYHSYSRTIDYPEASEREYANFEKVYLAICKEMEDKGYMEIEYQNSAEYIDEAMEANEYTFTKDGKRLNADK